MITKDEIIKECQKAAENAWNSAPFTDFMFAGFANIKINGATSKEKLEALGFRVVKAYPYGFKINVDDLFDEPDYVKSIPDIRPGVNNVRAAWQQSLYLKEVVAKVACDLFKKEGIDCEVDSFVD